MFVKRCLVWFVFVLVSDCRCQSLVDPHDMFEIFNAEDIPESRYQPLEEGKKANVISKRNEVSNGSKLCLDFVYALLNNIQLQFKDEILDRDHDVTIRLSLTSSEIETLLSHRIDSEQQRLKICSVLKESVQREPLITRLSTVLYSIRSAGRWIYERFRAIPYWIGYFRFQYKNFVSVTWACVFLTTVMVLMKFRSVMLSVLWLLLCILFFSTYTTYQHKYQTLVAEQEVMFMQFTGTRAMRDCLKPTKSSWHSFTEFITGPRPVAMSSECMEFFRQKNISPEIEIKLSDCLAETVFSFFTKFIHVIVDNAHLVADKSSAKFSFFTSWGIYLCIFISTIIFAFCLVSICFGHELSFFGLRVRPSQDRSFPFRGHRQFVETVSSPQAGTQEMDLNEHQMHPPSCVCSSTRFGPNLRHRPYKGQQKPFYRKTKSQAPLKSPPFESDQPIVSESFERVEKPIEQAAIDDK